MPAEKPVLPPGCALVTESPHADLPALTHPGWGEAFPWLVQGTTVRGPEEPFDLGLFSEASPAGRILGNWERLRRATGFERAVHARQVHGATVRDHGEGAPGLHLAEACDGHVTRTPGLLLAVTTADCVPVFVVAPRERAVALLHAGWRGAAAGILERGVEALARRSGALPGGMALHLGPSICGDCYEVGPEVFEGLGLEVPVGPTPVDLRAALAVRAVGAGIPGRAVTVSTHCTLCGDVGLFSHRGGDAQRQVGFLGIRP